MDFGLVFYGPTTTQSKTLGISTEHSETDHQTHVICSVDDERENRTPWLESQNDFLQKLHYSRTENQSKMGKKKRRKIIFTDAMKSFCNYAATESSNTKESIIRQNLTSPNINQLMTEREMATRTIDKIPPAVPALESCFVLSIRKHKVWRPTFSWDRFPRNLESEDSSTPCLSPAQRDSYLCSISESDFCPVVYLCAQGALLQAGLACRRKSLSVTSCFCLFSVPSGAVWSQLIWDLRTLSMN